MGRDDRQGTGGSERRRDPRYARTLPLRVGHDANDGLQAESINISARGIYCKVPRYVPPFSKLKVGLDLPQEDGSSRPVECDGVVVRVEPEAEQPGTREYRLAIYFLNLDRPDADAINGFLEDTQN